MGIALNFAHRHVLECVFCCHEADPYHHGVLQRGLYRFFNGRYRALLLLLAPRRLFFRCRWLILLSVATAGFLGNFVFLSTSVQYLNPAASRVIGQLSLVGITLASVVILKERMHITHADWRFTDIFNSSLREIFIRLIAKDLGGDLWLLRGNGLVELWRGTKILLQPLASQQILLLL